MCMLLRSSLPVAFGWLALNCAVYLLNRLSTKTVLEYMSPYEYLYGALRDLKCINAWGCKCHALKPKADRQQTSTKKTTQDSSRDTLHKIWGTCFLCRYLIGFLGRCAWWSMRSYPPPLISTLRSSSGSRTIRRQSLYTPADY